MFFYRYKDLLFEVTTGPAPSFVFTLSLSFDFNVSTKDYAMPSEPRWQMTPMEYATFLNSSKGDDSGKCFVQFTPLPSPPHPPLLYHHRRRCHRHCQSNNLTGEFLVILRCFLKSIKRNNKFKNNTFLNFFIPKHKRTN